MRTIDALIPTLALTLAAACTGGTADSDTAGMGGQFGEEAGARCEVERTTPVAADQPTALGFTVDQVAALFADEAGTLAWADGTTGPFTLTAQPDTASGRLVELVFVPGEDGMEIGMDCPPYLELDVALAVRTDDGRLDEGWTAPFQSPSADATRWWDEVEGFSGTLEVVDFASRPADEYDAVRAFVEVGFAGGASWGLVSGQGEGTDGEVAWAEGIEVGQWGAPHTGDQGG